MSGAEHDTTQIREAVSEVVGRTVVALRPSFGGLSSGWRGVVELVDRTTVFARIGDALTADSVRREIRVLQELQRPWTPAVIAADAESDAPILVLEDLSNSRWLPPYPSDSSPLFHALDQLRQAPIPEGLAVATQQGWHWPRLTPRIEELSNVAGVPLDWLRAAAPVLESAEASLDHQSRHLVHGDIHSGNLCLTSEGAVLVDWGRARLGPPLWDTTALCGDMIINGQQPRPAPNSSQLAVHAASFAGATALLLLAPDRPWVTDPVRAKSHVGASTRGALRWAQQRCHLPG